MSTSIVTDTVKSVNIVFSGKEYPEVRACSIDGKLTSVLPWKIFLHKNGLLSGADLADPKCSYDVIAWGILRAFQTGALSLNATKQKGVCNLTPVRVSDSLGGKMKGVPAISTLSLVNPFCIARMKRHELVCYHCYVRKSLHIMAVVRYVQNFFVLTSGPLPTEWIPVFKQDWANKHPYFRLESFGDLFCTTQAENYIRIAYTNQDLGIKFAIWTKNPHVWATAVDNLGKPEHMSAVLSMSQVNKLDRNYQRWLKYFDHIFEVADDGTIIAELLTVDGAYPCQCGPYSCFHCHACYETTDGDATMAVEKLRK